MPGCTSTWPVAMPRIPGDRVVSDSSSEGICDVEEALVRQTSARRPPAGHDRDPGVREPRHPRHGEPARPSFQRSEIFGIVAGFGTTFAGLPDLLSMLKRRSSAGMNPRMAAIMLRLPGSRGCTTPADRVPARGPVEPDRDRDQRVDGGGLHVLRPVRERGGQMRAITVEPLRAGSARLEDFAEPGLHEDRSSSKPLRWAVLRHGRGDRGGQVRVGAPGRGPPRARARVARPRAESRAGHVLP